MKYLVENQQEPNIFEKIEVLAVRIGATLVFIVFVGVEVFHAISKLLGK